MWRKDIFVVNERSRHLVVLLHGLRRGPFFLRGLKDATLESLPDADVYIPRMPFSIISTTSPLEIGHKLVAAVDELVARRERRADGGKYHQIILVGHSFGAALARTLWVIANGAQPDAQVRHDAARPWAPLISRVVMLAAVSRGYSTNSPATLRGRIRFWIGDLIEMALGRCLTAFSLRRGAPFLTTLRLQCLAVADLYNKPGEPSLTTVQLLGTKDDFVPPTDNIDMATSRGFFFLEVPKSGHLDITDFNEKQAVVGGRAIGDVRRESYRFALTAADAELRRSCLPTRDLYRIFEESEDSFDTDNEVENERARKKLEGVQWVVFIVHGIRDYGYWTRKMAAHIRRHARLESKSCRCVTSSYGFFPMGPFILPSVRRRRAEWLLDQYVQARALYPNAQFSFIGHSNGTYLLANALTTCPAIKFETVVFAGSVVSTKFPWHTVIANNPGSSGQVSRVANYVATGDWVVASFPRFLQWMPWFDLGSAGHDGFRQPAVRDLGFVPGEHSAALQEDFWQEIATCVLGGPEPLDRLARERSNAPLPKFSDRQSSYLRLAWLMAPIAAVGLLGLIWVPLIPLGFPGPFKEVLTNLALAPYVWALAFLACAWLISRVLTRL